MTQVSKLSAEDQLLLLQTVHHFTCTEAECAIDKHGVPYCVECKCSHTNGAHTFEGRCMAWGYDGSRCRCKEFRLKL